MPGAAATTVTRSAGDGPLSEFTTRSWSPSGALNGTCALTWYGET